MPDPLRAVDTNVVLWYLLSDVPDQAERARRLIDSEQPLGLTIITLAESAWTLAGPVYNIDRSTVAALVINFLARENIVAIGFDKVEAHVALAACLPQTGAANFGDALIAACSRSEGINGIYSFDQRFSRAGLVPVAPQ
ncbi:MAG: PIN domain-containing protein [Chloroflexi bacterium]|nr:PIN domain-containing protein [Chloroflexota bacterium]